MKIPEEKQYENLTTHLRYLNEKIIQSFTLFVKLASAIVGQNVHDNRWESPPFRVRLRDGNNKTPSKSLT